MNKINIDKEKIRRSKVNNGKEDDEEQKEPMPVVAGAIEKIADYLLNPSREKIREVTSISQIQAKLLPQLDLIESIWQYVIEIATYRQNTANYKQAFKRPYPISPSTIDDFIYRTAQWQKSVNAMNLKSGLDLALAEVQARMGEEGDRLDGFGDDD